MPSDTEELQAWRVARPTRLRATRAYSLTIRILAGYAWLRLRRPFLGADRYDALLVERHRASSRRITRAILELGGLFIKVGQLISILTNFLPYELRAELEQLQDSVPARRVEEVTARIRKELGASPDELFASFDPVPIASASLAQVHVAVTRAGQRVAVKVQHADIEETARLDLETLRGILRLVRLVVPLSGIESYHGDIAQLIHQELDFTQEARNIATIHAHFASDAMVHFPVVVPELSTARVLTTVFVDGIKVTDFARIDAAHIDRPALAERILRAYCQMVFVDGVYHADPHPGNILAHEDGSITFVDFGAIGRLAPGMKAGVPMFWDGVIRRDVGRIAAALRQMGMIARDAGLGEDGVAERVINYFQKRFLEQLTVDSFALKDIQVDMRTRIDAIADLKKLDVSFRNISRSFQVPKEWVIFERTSLLLLGLTTQIDPDMNPLRTIAPFLQEFVLGKDADWKTQIAASMRDVALSAIALPDKANQFLDRTNRGDLHMQIGALPESALLLYSAVHQVLFAFLAVAAGGLAYGLESRGDERRAVIAWIATAAFLAGVAVSMFRARRLRRAVASRTRRLL
ncbi:MAG TPA: AarF/UbiB family protein [Gemmatimonadaceae bacterium]|nr:AarF/UbiB family protein [Gemmatimonadaceae bacterium]